MAKLIQEADGSCIWEFPKISGTLFWVNRIRIPLFRVLYYGPLFSEAPISWGGGFQSVELLGL